MDSISEQFERIYDQYIDKIYRFVYLKVGSEDIAEDIVSKVFIKGWKSYQEQGQEIKNPSAFLYQIARNSVVDYYRERGRTKTVSSDILPEIIDSDKNLQDRAIFTADLNLIKKSIQNLKKEHQDVIIWHYLEDMPIKEIALLVDKSEGAVRVMLHRGLKDLKDIIHES